MSDQKTQDILMQMQPYSVHPYNPRNIVCVVVPQGEQADQFPHHIKHALELCLLRTEVRARERQDGASLLNDTMENYHQEFEFTERKDKALYTAFRVFRDAQSEQPWNLMIIEPTEDLCGAADAWLIEDCKIGTIRNSVTPSRLLTEPKKQSDLQTTGTGYSTFVMVTGLLRHDIATLLEARQMMKKMNEGLPAWVTGPTDLRITQQEEPAKN